MRLPGSLRTIAQGAFSECERLKTVKFSEGLEALGTKEHTDDDGPWCGVFQKSELESVELPRTLKVILHGEFEKCKNLKNITLPEGLERIGDCCFYESALESITLPSTLKTI